MLETYRCSGFNNKLSSNCVKYQTSLINDFQKDNNIFQGKVFGTKKNLEEFNYPFWKKNLEEFDYPFWKKKP